MVMYEPEALVGDAPQSEPASLFMSSVMTTTSDVMQGVDIVGLINPMIATFAKSLEARFSQVDCRFSQGNHSSSSLTQSSNVSCQDVDNHSLSVPPPVAVCSEHPPNRDPSEP